MLNGIIQITEPLRSSETMVIFKMYLVGPAKKLESSLVVTSLIIT